MAFIFPYKLYIFFQRLQDFVSSNTLNYMISIFKCLQRKTQRLYGKMKAILLPRNYLKFPLVTLIVSKIAYKSLQNTKIVHFLRIFYRNVDRENFFRDFAKIICIESRKFVETNQGYQSHQLLSDLDTYIRRYCSFLKMACNHVSKSLRSWCD